MATNFVFFGMLSSSVYRYILSCPESPWRMRKKGGRGCSLPNQATFITFQEPIGHFYLNEATTFEQNPYQAQPPPPKKRFSFATLMLQANGIDSFTVSSGLKRSQAVSSGLNFSFSAVLILQLCSSCLVAESFLYFFP